MVDERFSPNSWNIYAFHCSDGENWSEDNEKAKNEMEKIIELAQLSGYIQIKNQNDQVWGEEMAEIFSPLIRDNFKILNIKSKDDIWPEFARLFGGKYEL